MESTHLSFTSFGPVPLMRQSGPVLWNDDSVPILYRYFLSLMMLENCFRVFLYKTITIYRLFKYF